VPQADDAEHVTTASSQSRDCLSCDRPRGPAGAAVGGQPAVRPIDTSPTSVGPAVRPWVLVSDRC
jgi:hypothetical protein